MARQSGHVCQRCRLPLVAHESVANLTSAQLSLLTARNGADFGVPASEGRATITAGGVGEFRGVPGGSYVLLTESLMARSLMNPGDREVPPNEADEASSSPSPTKKEDANSDRSQMSKRVSKLEALYEVLSAKSDIDYPMCTDCAELVKAELKPRYKQSCEERDTFIGFLNKIRDQPNPGSEEMQEMLRDIAELEKANEEVLAELKEAEETRRAVEAELQALDREAEALDREEEEFFKEQNAVALEVRELEAERDRLNSLHAYNTKRLQKLQRINVYNDAFCIASDGHFGTINGLRLGSLRDKRVEWPEINAAWGQIVLLMATIIQKLKIKVNGYRLRPLGSMSAIDKIERSPKPGVAPKAATLPLHFNEEFLNSLFASKRLDPGMVAFLDVLRQVCEYVESRDPDLRIPYAIDKDKIGGQSIRLGSSTYDAWTGACKYVLTDCKWALAYAATH